MRLGCSRAEVAAHAILNAVKAHVQGAGPSPGRREESSACQQRLLLKSRGASQCRHVQATSVQRLVTLAAVVPPGGQSTRTRPFRDICGRELAAPKRPVAHATGAKRSDAPDARGGVPRPRDLTPDGGRRSRDAGAYACSSSTGRRRSTRITSRSTWSAIRPRWSRCCTSPARLTPCRCGCVCTHRRRPPRTAAPVAARCPFGHG